MTCLRIYHTKNRDGVAVRESMRRLDHLGVSTGTHHMKACFQGIVAISVQFIVNYKGVIYIYTRCFYKPDSCKQELNTVETPSQLAPFFASNILPKPPRNLTQTFPNNKPRLRFFCRIWRVWTSKTISTQNSPL